jgi:hypothetical protein
MLAELKKLLSDAKLAATKSGQSVDLSDMSKVLDSVDTLRKDKIAPIETKLKASLSRAAVGAIALGGVLLGITVLAVTGAVFLVLLHLHDACCMLPCRRESSQAVLTLLDMTHHAGQLAACLLSWRLFHSNLARLDPVRRLHASGLCSG